MLATVFLAAFVTIPLGLTLITSFRRDRSLATAPAAEPMPRWSMKDFRPREDR